MIVQVCIYYTDNPFKPRVFFASWEDAWQLWFTLTKAMQKGISGPHVEAIKIFNEGRICKPEKGIADGLV